MTTQFNTYIRDITAFMYVNEKELIFYLNECLRLSTKNINRLMLIQNQIFNFTYAFNYTILRSFTFRRGLLNG